MRPAVCGSLVIRSRGVGGSCRSAGFSTGPAILGGAPARPVINRQGVTRTRTPIGQQRRRAGAGHQEASQHHRPDSGYAGHGCLSPPRVLISGIISRKIAAVPLANVKDLGFERSAAGNLFGYGTFTITAEGKPKIVIDYIPYPEQLYLEFVALLNRNDREDDDEPD